MRTRQKRVLIALSVMGLVLLGIVMGAAIVNFLQITDKETETTNLVTVYPLNLQVDVASEIFTSISNDYWLNTTLTNTEAWAAEYQIVYEIQFPGIIDVADVVLVGDGGQNPALMNSAPAIVPEQINTTSITFVLEYYAPGSPIPALTGMYYTWLSMTLPWDTISGPLTVVLWAEKTT